jgi:hypothetical protein
MNDAIVALRTWPVQTDRARVLAAKLFPDAELLGVTARGVLRLALHEGLETFDTIDSNHLSLARAEKAASFFFARVNKSNAALTPDDAAQFTLFRGIADIHRAKFGAKERPLNIRVPGSLKTRLDAAVNRVMLAGPPPAMETTSAIARLFLEVGLHVLEYRAWDEKSRRLWEAKERARTPADPISGQDRGRSF